MLKIKVYRHIYHKNIYLCRNWSFCGGGPSTEFYYASRDLMKAITDANRKGFESWMNSFLDENGKTVLKAKMIDAKEVDLDGYKGKLEKELTFPAVEFELIELCEV